MEPSDASSSPQSSPTPRRTFWKNPSFLVVSIALHLLFGAGATYWVVSRQTARKLTFQGGPPNPSKGQKAMEHTVQLAKQRQHPPPAAAPKRIAVNLPAKVELPPMAFTPVRSTAPAPGRLGAMSPMSGVAAGFGAPGSLGLGGASGGGIGGLNFFGIRDKGREVVVMIDVSDSMFTRTGDVVNRKLAKTGAEQSFQAVREEAGKLLRSLPPDVRFGIVRWSGGAYPWKEQLVPASPTNVNAALAHLRDEVDFKTAKPRDSRSGGTRTDIALEEAFKLRPEVIYMLTDGNATEAQPGGGLKEMPAEQVWGAAEAGQKAAGAKRARLHVIYYLTGADRDDERAMLTALANKNGGQFRTVDAPGRKERGR